MFTIPFKGRGLAGMGDTTSTDPSSTSIVQSVTDLVTAYNQEQILKANTDRAALGLPPLNTASISPTYNVGLSPDVKSLLIIGGLALLGVIFLAKRR